MSGKSEKLKRKLTRKTIEKNKDLVMESVIVKLKKSDFKTRFAFCVLILFSRKR
jgi:hypothetical protein